MADTAGQFTLSVFLADTAQDALSCMAAHRRPIVRSGVYKEWEPTGAVRDATSSFATPNVMPTAEKLWCEELRRPRPALVKARACHRYSCEGAAGD